MRSRPKLTQRVLPIELTQRVLPIELTQRVLPIELTQRVLPKLTQRVLPIVRPSASPKAHGGRLRMNRQNSGTEAICRQNLYKENDMWGGGDSESETFKQLPFVATQVGSGARA